MEKLTEFQFDALTEVINIGVGRAASILNEMIETHISLQIPEIKVTAEQVTVKQLLINCKLVSTGGEAKRLCSQSAVMIDGQKKQDPNEQIMPRDGMVIQVGKRKFAKLKL